ncbi:hypothetical protein H4Q26_005010 [Puccinia striiformis f. sp. tritici PST-130]|nr:hypothetical protein Pst134EB_008024 [Puccinia striiformis f. sp. tritici]KAI9608821.1 hypothetical protein H4Q26_005010 [Puccinia striiformis f. sp. tritici PST-130]
MVHDRCDAVYILVVGLPPFLVIHSPVELDGPVLRPTDSSRFPNSNPSMNASWLTEPPTNRDLPCLSNVGG